MAKARSRQIGVCVEVAPLGSVADVLREEPLDWVNISGWVRLDQGITVSRGVGSDGHTPDTGTLSVTLDNDTGGWTPGRDFTTLLESVVGESEWAATFEGNIRDETSIKGLPVRVRHLGNVPTYAETQALYVDYAAWMAAEETYADTINPEVLWTGVISTVRQVWAGGFAPQVKVAAADPVAVLERQPMRSLPVTAVTHAAAAAWWGPLHVYEVALRNAIHARLTALAGQPEWWHHAPTRVLLSTRDQKVVESTAAAVVRRYKESASVRPWVREG